MNIDRTPIGSLVRRAALTAVTLGAFAASALAGTISGTLTYGGAVGSRKLVVVVATTTANQYFVVASSVIASPTFPQAYSISGLTGAAGVQYAVYAFLDDPAYNTAINGNEARGGNGPFPRNVTATTPFPSTSTTVSGTAETNFPLRDRVAITGTVVNQSDQTGLRLLVQASDGSAETVTVSLSMGGGGAFSLLGLTTGTTYGLTAWVDTDGGTTANPYESQISSASWATPSSSYTFSGAALTILDGNQTGSAPDNIFMSDDFGNTFQTIVADSPSARLHIAIQDIYGEETSTTSITTVTFNQAWGLTGPLSVGTDILVSTNNFLSTTSFVTVPVNVSTSPYFQVKTAAGVAGWVSLQGLANNFPATGQSRWTYYNFEVLAAGSGFTNVSMRTDSGTPASGGQVTLSPDHDGSNDAAIITFDPPGGGGWEVLISTLPFSNAQATDPANLVLRNGNWGSGYFYWYGNDQRNDWRTAPNGTYYVRLQANGGGIVYPELLTIVIQTVGIGGTVTTGGSTPLADVDVNCWGPNGGGYARTDESGNFFVAGLRSGVSYTLNFSKPAYASEQLQNVLAGTTGVAANLDAGSTFRFQAVLLAGAPQEVWGGVNVHTLDWSSNANGPVHFKTGEIISDNGRWSDDPDYSTYTLVGVLPATRYKVEMDLREFGRITQEIISPPSGQTDTYIATDYSQFNTGGTGLTRKPVLQGAVSFPAPVDTPYGGEWVSVDATPPGSDFPTAFGGAFVANDTSSTTYFLNGVDSGVNTLRAFSRGYKTLTRTYTVGTTDASNVDFPVFAEGGKILGTITVTGNSVGVDADTYFGSFCGTGFFPVSVNAWSPTTYNGAWTQACVPEDASQSSVGYALTGLDDGDYEVWTWLPGFQLNPPNLPKRVTVTNGTTATPLNLNFAALNGSINLTVALAAGQDPALVEYDVESRNGSSGTSIEGTLNGAAQATISGLGTGLYEISLENGNNGLQKRVGVPVTNGQATNITVPMLDTTYGLSGTVSLQGSISLSTNSTTVTISSAAAIGDWVPAAPNVQVFSFPLPDHFSGRVTPYREITATPSGTDATYTLTGLVPGSYLVRVQEDINPNQESSNCPDCVEPGLPEFGTTEEVVFVSDNKSGVDLTLTNGVKVTGTISRPSDDTSTDSRTFDVALRRTDNLSVWKTSTTTAGTGKATYTFPHIGAGQYIVDVREDSSAPKYAAKPKSVTVASSDVTQNITLVEAGNVVGKIRDKDSNTLLTSRNLSQFLSGNFGVFAQANPWVEGGWQEAERNHSGGGQGGIYISSVTGQFLITRLVPDTSYDVTFKGFTGLGEQEIARGQKAYAPVVKSGVRVSEGQTVDVGIIDLVQGVSISGTVTDSAGTPIPNIRVVGEPAVSNGGEDRGQLSIEGFTNAQGVYSLQGVDREKLYYDVIAAPRWESGDVLGSLAGKKYGEERYQMVDVTDAAKRTGVDFTLTEANCVVAGRVVTADGGPLKDPFGNHGPGGDSEKAPRRARITMHLDGAALSDNPLGEIEESTDFNGNFRIDGLKPGSYTLRAISIGYVTEKKVIVVAAGDNNAGVLTLQKGASVSGTITKPNGTNPTTEEVDGLVGVDKDFEEFVFGSISSNSDTKEVTGYSLTGFKTGLKYSIVIFSGKDDLIEAKSGLTFGSASEDRTVNLVFRPSPPTVFATQSRSGNRFTVRFFSTQKLRNLTDDDNDMTKIVQLVAGGGTIVSRTLGSSRDMITVVYDKLPTERTFKLRLAFSTIVVDPDSASGTNFAFNQDFKIFAGARRMRIVRVPNAIGGSATLEGDPTGGSFSSGGFEVDSSSRVEIGVLSAATLDDLSPTAPRAGPTVGAPAARAAAAMAQQLGPEAYPNEGLYRAVQAAPAVSPFSAFYDIFLPAGVSHTLKKEALLTLKYDDTVTDPSNLNIYYFDPNNNVFLLENSKRKIDTRNKTITVGVKHASTFVVLNNNAQIVGANSYTGTEIMIHNFPNPFNLKSKTVALNHNPTAPSQTVEGTMIDYALPSGKSGAVKIEIYNVAGELVRTISEDAATGGTYYYTQWDGRNDGGKQVASGVYIARFTLNGGDEKFFKMAVIK